MAGLGRVLGGIAKGLGDGLVRQGEEMRQLALEQLRHQNDMQGRKFTADRQDQAQQQGFANQKELVGVNAEADKGVATHRAGLDAERDKTRHGYDVDMSERQYGQRKGLAAFEAGLSDSNDARSINRRAEGKSNKPDRQRDNDMVERIQARHTKVAKDARGNETTTVDHNAIANELNAMGRSDLGVQFRPAPSGERLKAIQAAKRALANGVPEAEVNRKLNELYRKNGWDK